MSLCRRPADQVDDQRIDRQAGHALGGIDGQADRLFGAVEIDDDAGLDAVRLLVADADDLDLVGAARAGSGSPRAASAGDHAADLGRTDVEHGDDAGSRWPTASRLTAKPAHMRFSGLLSCGLGRARQRGLARRFGRLRASAAITMRSARRRSTATMSRVKQAGLAVQLQTSSAIARSTLVFRQLDGDAIVEPQIPAAAGDPDIALHARRQARETAPSRRRSRRRASPRPRRRPAAASA